jgi:hypothetical protein
MAKLIAELRVANADVLPASKKEWKRIEEAGGEI